MKKVAIQEFRDAYKSLRTGWLQASLLPPEELLRQIRGYDDWIAQANNAALGAQGAYDDLVPAMEALHADVSAGLGPAWPPFYDAVKAMASLPMSERRRALDAVLARHAPAAAP